MKISIIGAGNMGGSIARGLSTSSCVEASNIVVADRSQSVLDQLKKDCPMLQVSTENQQAVTDADMVILAVKPWLVSCVIDEIRPFIDLSRQTFICIAAGVSFADLSSMLHDDVNPLFRIIPNTAIAIKESVNLLSVQRASEAQVTAVKRVFDELGSTILVDEHLLDSGTAITSCGIAYAFQYIKAAMQGAIELGFYPQVAKAMINQTLKGAVGLLETNDSMPDQEIYKVCTPGGITIKGLNEMAAQGFDHAVIAGLKKAAGK